MRETANRAEERLRAIEQRALLEIERERSAVAKAQEELAEAAKRADKREAEHRRIVEALQAQQGDARHQNGVFQGSSPRSTRRICNFRNNGSHCAQRHGRQRARPLPKRVRGEAPGNQRLAKRQG